jgi:ubiquinone/menaquinone biosynthesis C-methylase UbiE
MKADQQTWATGDFSMVGAAQVMVGEYLCEAVRLRPGERVLDVATGSGNTAISAARRVTEVVGIDFVPALLERARERAEAERLTKRVTFELGDAENLPVPDHSFDVVLSTFGCMFAPDPVRTTKEMARVCRPGGRIGISAWTPAGLIGRMFTIHARHVPPAPGLQSPSLWGDENVVRERFAGIAAKFSFERRVHIFRALTPEQWFGFMCKFFGPTMVAWDALDESGREAFSKDLLANAAQFNQSGDETLMAPGEYLESVITLR